MPNFAIHKQFSNVGDIQRTYNFLVTVSNLGDVANIEGKDLQIRARTAVLPGRSNEPIESDFMGMKQHFPGKLTFPYTFSIEFEEFEDRIVSKALYNWQQLIFDASNTGSSQVESKQEYAKNIDVQLYKNNNVKVSKEDNGLVRIYNCWPQDIADVELSYADSASVKYSATFQYDRWDYVR